MELTNNEQKIILAIRSLKPFEKVEIQADQKGRIDYYTVHRSYREILDPFSLDDK